MHRLVEPGHRLVDPLELGPGFSSAAPRLLICVLLFEFSQSHSICFVDCTIAGDRRRVRYQELQPTVKCSCSVGVGVGGPLDTSEKIAMHAGAREHELSSDAEDAAQCVMRVTSVHKRKVARRPSSHAQTDSTEAQQSPHVDARTLRCSALHRGRVAPRRTQRRRFGRRHPRGTAFGSSVASCC